MTDDQSDRGRRIEARLVQWWPILEDRLAGLYDADPRLGPVLDQLRARLVDAALRRPEALWRSDLEFEASRHRLSAPGQAVYSFYVDRFAENLEGVRAHLDYFAELGIRWLHPLPLLRARDGDSDGGFAVSDYRSVDPRLGTMSGLQALADAARARGIGLILDVVCNHTAAEHEWACKARAGSPAHRDYYIVVEDPSAVADWEKTLTDVFPSTAPGSFTYVEEMGGWVWTTFYPFQWDLNYRNPQVFCEMLEILLHLASMGVQGFRLDSAPYLWKEAGTDCRNRPQAYAIVEAWRAALAIAAPGVLLLAEAIEHIEDVLPFFGTRSPGCDLAYNNVVMTALWAGLADQDAAILRRCLETTTLKPERAAWLNYLRCHDDVIWTALGGYASERDLERWSRFYGAGAGFSRGVAFHAAAGAAPSTNGMASSLAGVSLDRSQTNDLGLRRLLMLYGAVFALDGWPLVYMGDELALGDDETFALDPKRAAEGRWLHRPAMDWAAAARRRDVRTVEGAAFARFGLLARAVARLADLGVAGPAVPFATEARAVLGFVRSQGETPFLCLANLSPNEASVVLPSPFDGGSRDLLSERQFAGRVELEGYGLRWLVPA